MKKLLIFLVFHIWMIPVEGQTEKNITGGVAINTFAILENFLVEEEQRGRGSFSIDFRFRKPLTEHWSVRTGIGFGIIKTSYTELVWVEGERRQASMKWGVDYQIRKPFFELFFFLDGSIRQSHEETSSGGGFIFYFQDSIEDHLAFSILPGTGFNVLLGEHFLLGFETYLEISFGQTNRTWWTYGNELNKMQVTEYQSEISWRPIGGLFVGFKF